MRSVSGPTLSLAIGMLALLAAACGQSEPSFPTPAPTPIPVASILLAQATPLCATPFDGRLTQGAARAPAIALKQIDEGGLGQQYRDRNLTPGEWIGENTYNAARNTQIGYLLPYELRAASAETVQSLVCVRERRIEVGTYQEVKYAAGRLDWDVRVLRWPDGAVLAANSFRGGDPPDVYQSKSRTDPCGSNLPGAVCLTQYGKSPQDDFMTWLKTVLAT